MVSISQELRQAVLQAAIQGKLTEQLLEDGNARNLLFKIRTEKERLIKEKKIKKEKPLEPISESEIPFDIPSNWKWERWGNLSNSIQYGYNAPAVSSGKVKMVRISDIQGDRIIWDTVPFCDIKDSDIEEYRLHETDILFARTGGTVGKSCLVSSLPKDVPYVYAGYLIRSNYNGNMSPAYLKLFMGSELYWNQLRTGTTKSAQPNCNGKTLSKMIIPIPPLAEQRRIVACVKKLMAKIDELEKVENELRALHQAFPNDMKAALLQAAMQGRLTEQLPEDGNARDLLVQINSEKKQLVKEKVIKKERIMEPITEDEIPYDIPDNWEWARLGAVTHNWGQKTPDNTFCYIDVGSINNQAHKLNKENNTVEAKDASSRARKIVHVGDVIFATIRPYLQNICIIDREFPYEAIVSTAFAVMHCPKGLCNKYLYYYLLSPYFMSYTNAGDKAKGVAYPAIGETDFFNGIIPIPPLAEQRRIVAKLEELLPLIDSLEK